MKKLSFIIAMAFVTFMAMAQNSAVISTTGDYNDAFITQGISNNNTASILQVQNAAPLYHSLAQITQEASSWGKITQYDTRNYATIGEKLNDKAEIFQNGSVNNSNISFNYGMGNNAAYVQQVGTYNGGYIYSTSQHNGYVNPLTIVQNGNSNNGIIESGWNAPTSNYNDASITQTGDNNKSKVRQEGGDVNVASVAQTGNNDEANLLQHGTYLKATITQLGGNGNIVNLDQTGGVATIYQNGSSNIVRGLKDPVLLTQDPLALFAGSTLDVNQLGQGNTLDLKSTTPGSIVNVFQNGMLNKSMVIQN